MENKKKDNSKLLVILVSIMSVVCIGVLSVIGVIVYKGYASKNDSVLNTETSFNEDEFYSYFDAVTLYVDTYSNYAYEVYPIVNTNMSKEDEERIINLTNDFILYSQSFSTEPVTYQDILFKEHFDNLKIDAEIFADYINEYTYKNEEVYLKFINNSLKNTQIHLDTLNEFRERHY